MQRSLKLLFSATGAAIVSYLHMMSAPIVILLVVMLLDYASGMAKAWLNVELSSKIGRRGIIKKLSCMMIVIAAACVDWLLASGLTMVGISMQRNYYFGVMVTIWLIVNELISVLENLSEIGVPLPGFLTKIVKHLKTSIEDMDKEE